MNKLLIARRIPEHNLQQLQAVFEVEHNQADALWSAADLAQRLADKHAVFTTAGEPMTAAVLSALLVSCWMRLTMSTGVPAGAIKPNHELASKPFNPAASSILGSSGVAAERCALVTAKALSLPALI